MTRQFTGVTTALITPFTEDDDVDYPTLGELIDMQITAGCGILVNGTTGESPTLEDDEFEKIVKFVVEKAKGKVPIMVGTGSNNTKKSIAKSQLAERLGADGLLLVTPYYNKPEQDDLLYHFTSVANSVQLPIIIYNIEGRTCRNIETPTMMELAKVSNIVGVKEASGNMDQIQDVCTQRPDDFSVLLGDDSIAWKSMQAFGADGVVSVISNAHPDHMAEMCSLLSNEKTEEAYEIHKKLEPLMENLLSIGVNPKPIKAYMHEKGLIKCGELRPPLRPLTQDKISTLMKAEVK